MQQSIIHEHTHTHTYKAHCRALEFCYLCHLGPCLFPDVHTVIRARPGPVKPKSNLSFTKPLLEYLKSSPTLYRPSERQLAPSNHFTIEGWETEGKQIRVFTNSFNSKLHPNTGNNIELKYNKLMGKNKVKQRCEIDIKGLLFICCSGFQDVHCQSSGKGYAI